jgi:hypothetical protein
VKLYRRVIREQQYLDALQALGVGLDDPRIVAFEWYVKQDLHLKLSRRVHEKERTVLYAHRTKPTPGFPSLLLYFSIRGDGSHAHLEGALSVPTKDETN